MRSGSRFLSSIFDICSYCRFNRLKKAGIHTNLNKATAVVLLCNSIPPDWSGAYGLLHYTHPLFSNHTFTNPSSAFPLVPPNLPVFSTQDCYYFLCLSYSSSSELRSSKSVVIANVRLRPRLAGIRMGMAANFDSIGEMHLSPAISFRRQLISLPFVCAFMEDGAPF